MSSFHCMCCHSRTGHPFLNQCKDYYLQKPIIVDYWQCSTCHLVQQYPLANETASFYENYPIHQKKNAIFNFFRQIVNGGLYFRPSTSVQPQLLLDYGCGDGFFLEQLSPQYTTVGFEPSPEHALRLSKRLGIAIESNPEELKIKYKEKFDVITMHFVLEHVLDLDQVMIQCRETLKKGGQLYIVVPHIFSFEAKLFGRYWHNLDAPRHICFPNPETLKRLCQRHGFRLAAEKNVSFPNGFAASIPVILTGKFRFWLYVLFLPLGILFSRIFPTAAKSYLLEKNV